MNAAIVKIDVAAAALGWSAAKLFKLKDGGDLVEKGFAWVFNLANNPEGYRQDLRFWFPEILARADKDTAKHGKYSNWEIGWVVANILPEKRQHFHAGEVDQIFQIRPRTRLDYGTELNGGMVNGRTLYPRETLAAFLTSRWLGVCSNRQSAIGNSKSPLTSTAMTGGLAQVEAVVSNSRRVNRLPAPATFCKI